MRRTIQAGLVSLLLATPAAAQQEVEFGAQEMIPGPWKFDNFPYFTVTPNDGFMFIGRAQYGQTADFLDRVSMAKRFAIEGGLSPSGSRFLALLVDMPRLAPGWRLAGDVRVQRQARFGSLECLSIASSSCNAGYQLDSDEPGPRVPRVRTSGWVEVTRTIVGSLQVAAQVGVSETQWRRVPGPSNVINSVTGKVVTHDISESDATARLALILDTRDREFDTQKGLLLEGGYYLGSFGEGYDGGYAIASGFANPRFGTVLAARVGGRSVSAESSLDARYLIPAWEKPLTMLGGPGSHRALDLGRRAGQGVLFGSLEVRQVVIDGGDMAGIYLLAFLDAGRAFETERFTITTKDLQVGGGVGVAIRLLRANIFNTSVATGPDGVKVMVGSGWMF